MWKHNICRGGSGDMGGGIEAPPKLLPQGLCPPHCAIEYARKILQHHDSIYRLFKNFLPHEYKLPATANHAVFSNGQAAFAWSIYCLVVARFFPVILHFYVLQCLAQGKFWYHASA